MEGEISRLIMWLVITKCNKKISTFTTKYKAQLFIDNRKNLCNMLGVDVKHYYSIVKGTKNASTRLGKKRSMSF